MKRFEKIGVKPQPMLLGIGETLTKGTEFTDMVPKGRAIRMAIEAAKNEKFDYIIAID